MKVTNADVSRFRQVWNEYEGSLADGCRAALEDFASAREPEPVQGPFVLSAAELGARRRLECATSPYAVGGGDAALLLCALDRAVATLGPELVPGPFVLSAAEECSLITLEAADSPEVSMPDQVVIALALRRAERTLGPAQAGDYSDAQVQAALDAWFNCPGAPGVATRAALATAGVPAEADKPWSMLTMLEMQQKERIAELEAQVAKAPPRADFNRQADSIRELQARIVELEAKAALALKDSLTRIAELEAQVAAQAAKLAEKTDLLCRMQLPRDTQKTAFEAAQHEYVQHAGSVSNAALDYALNAYEKHREPQSVEPLNKEIRAHAEFAIKYGTGDSAEKAASELLRRCPKPAPKQRTPEELRDLVDHADYDVRVQALNELVALAKQAKP